MREQEEISFEDLHERRKQRRFYVVIFWVILCIYFATLGAALIVFRSPVLRVSSFSITGNSVISEDAILDVVRSAALEGKWRPLKALLGFRNMLTWPDAIHDPALLPGAKSITLEKDYSARSIVVRVDERMPYGIWCFDERGREVSADSFQCWWFDDDGVIFKRTVDSSGGILTVVHDYSQDSPGSLAKAIPGVFIENIFSVFSVLRFSELRVKEIALRDLSLQELEVSTHNGPLLYFSLRFRATNALAAIQDLKNKPGFSKLQYLDFRAENRVYYR